MKKKKLLALLLTVVMMVSLFSVTAFAAAASVNQASYNGTEYATLEAAIEAAKDSDDPEVTITLLTDITSEKTIEIPADLVPDLVIDFNGRTITFPSASDDDTNAAGIKISCTDDIGVTFQNGTIISTAKHTDEPADVNDAAAITIMGADDECGPYVTLTDMNVTSDGSAIVLIGSTTADPVLTVESGSVIESHGTAAIASYCPSIIEVAGTVRHTGTHSAINGSYVVDSGEIWIDIQDGAVIEATNPEGGGILQMAPGKVDIGNAKITGGTGVAITQGALTVSSGAEITGTGTYNTFQSSAEYHIYSNGAAIYVESEASTDGVSVTIEDGTTLTSENSYAVSVPEEVEGDVELSIEGGKFTGADDKGAIDAPNEEEFIIGGEFSGELDPTYVDSSHTSAELKKTSGTTTYVGVKETVADTLKEKAEAGDTIEVQKGDLTLENIAGDVTVSNTGSGNVSVNKQEVTSSGGTVKTEHVHAYADEYSYDANGHWKECTLPTCTDKKSPIEVHTFGNGVASADGITYTCKVCGYKDIKPAVDTPAHTHDYVTAYNTTSHWNACTVDGCTAPVVDKVDHVFKEEVVVNPTRNSKGVKTLTCSCGYSKIELLPELKNLIIGTCQIPNPDGSGGFLMGLETSENPNQSYQYEMQIYDCTQETWVYGTGLCGVPETSFWTTWNPIYGYYWTLFRVYDSNGVLLDQIIYGFENI